MKPELKMLHFKKENEKIALDKDFVKKINNITDLEEAKKIILLKEETRLITENNLKLSKEIINKLKYTIELMDKVMGLENKWKN